MATGRIFDLSRRIVPLPVAWLVALVQAWLWENALAALTPMTEPLGDFPAIAALWSFVVGMESRLAGRIAGRCRWVFALAGMCLGLSNLARPLTLLAVLGLPTMAGAVWLRDRPRTGGRRLVAARGVFVGAFVLTLGP